MFGKLCDDALHHVEERARIQLRLRGDLRSGDAEALLQVLFVADEHVDVLDDPRRAPTRRDRRRRPRSTASRGSSDRTRRPRRAPSPPACASMIRSAVVSDSDAKMPPLWNQRTPSAKMPFQSKSPGFSARRRFVASGCRRRPGRGRRSRGRCRRPPCSGPCTPSCAKRLVERRHAHRPHLPGDQLADRVVDHRRGDGGAHAEAVGQVRGAVELAAAHVDRAGAGLAERDDAGIEAMDEGAERQEVEWSRRHGCRAVSSYRWSKR